MMMRFLPIFACLLATAAHAETQADREWHELAGRMAAQGAQPWDGYTPGFDHHHLSLQGADGVQYFLWWMTAKDLRVLGRYNCAQNAAGAGRCIDNDNRADIFNYDPQHPLNIYNGRFVR